MAQNAIKYITQSLPGPVVELGTSLLGPDCYARLINDVAFLQPPYLADPALAACASLAASKLIGVGIVVLSSVIKLPQILKIVRARSAAGVSTVATGLEALSYLGMLAYAVRSGFPFSTYGESAFLFIQDVVLLFLLLSYSGRTWIKYSVVPSFLAATYSLVISVPGPSTKWLTYLQAATIPIGLSSKVPQIYQIWHDKSSGQLAAVSVFAYLAGSLARVFTTLQEVNDRVVLVSVTTGAVLNAILALQMIVYWNNNNNKPVTNASITKKSQ
ncbi:hypothetical protein V1514DRAFT_328484 [Lipomyces japonicus]|uniref:uncharacterized protein n=1 Tax=Lipomyces japonicus TaxID=56871 RepID=UPI0034CEAA40